MFYSRTLLLIFFTRDRVTDRLFITSRDCTLNNTQYADRLKMEHVLLVVVKLTVGL